MGITANFYGRTNAGQDVYEYTLTNENNVQVKIIEYGCIITQILVPCKNGTTQDVVWGYDTLQGYEQGTCHFGAFVGRCANRIKDAQFTLEGKTYALSKNDGENHLHGTFERRVFKGLIQEDTLLLSYTSPDTEEGYPGTLNMQVSYSLTSDNSLVIDYTATTDKTTILNVTNHSYFNLNGQDGKALDAHILQIKANSICKSDANTCPTGEFIEVAGTPMDFTTAKLIAQDIDAPYEALQLAGGYDHNYILDKQDGMLAHIATAKGLETGIEMAVYTTQPGMQLYSGNYLGNDVPLGKGNRTYTKRSAFCLETQHYPCAPSFAHFPSIVLTPQQEYHQTTVYQFTSK